MAEALVNYFLKDEWHAYSAGIVPAGYVHPLAIKVLQELGVEHHGYSKSVDDYIGKEFDRVITMCTGASLNCPVWLGKGLKEHIGFYDPTQMVGSLELRIQAFRNVRDEMLQKIVDHLRSGS